MKLIAKAFWGIVLAFFGGVVAIAQTDADQVTAIGRNVLSMDDYMLSIQYFNQAIRAKPYLCDPYYYRAIAKISLEDYAGAEEDCTLALERNKFKTECYRARGYARQMLGKDSLAVCDYEVGLTYNPNDKYFLFYKSVAETELQRFHDADSTFGTLLRLYPRFEDGYSARARLNLLRCDTVAALADIDTALGISPSQLQPRLLRADINARRHNWADAAADMDEAIRLNPTETDYYLNRAYLRYNDDDYFGAMADYNYAIELQPFNEAALFNRGLLRYEVLKLEGAEADFKEVLRLNPDNFHALFNLGLIHLEQGNNKAAAADFNKIVKRYPRFHTGYYALAQAYQALGRTREAMTAMYHGDDLVRAYVKNPKRNPLDRPAVESALSNDGSKSDDETEEEVMDRYNRLITVGDASDTRLSFNERIKGRVQDRDVNVDLYATYLLSFAPPEEALANSSLPYLPQLNDFNTAGYIDNRIYLTSGITPPPAGYDAWFDLADKYTLLCEAPGVTPAAWLALGVARTMLKDYDGAVRALDKALELYPDFLLAYIERGYVHQISGKEMQARMAMQDYDAALAINPHLSMVWLNKGNLYSQLGQYTSALDCYNRALAIDEHSAGALFNRGVTYLRLGNKRQAFNDLAKAGELGIPAGYNLLKRMK